ncbi:MAG: class I SAM-dependent methyltransferase, partial [Candidatus Pacebacteria bacterium]|nr:class I SAM-dependent methyltransferase [Candidatus Paceibacterota bacterium]
MSLYEIFTFKRLLKKIYKGQKIDILEWGSGGSTVYFTDFLRKKNIPYTWTSVEYNKGWHEKVSKEVSNDPDTKVVLFDVGNSVIRQRHTDMEDYIKYPKSTGQKFDLMFVDGRKRRRCLLESRDIVKNEGVVLLHDACRKYYQCSFREYPNNTFIGLNLWIGRINQVSFLRKILNRCQRFILETLFMYFIRPVR